MTLRGWIGVGHEAHQRVRTDPATYRRALEVIGVKVGGWNGETLTFEECDVSQEAMKRLDPLWGEFIWGLVPVEKNQCRP